MQAVPLLSHSIYVLHYFGLEVHETFTLKLIVTNIVSLSIRSSTRVVVVFACFLSSVSLLLLQVTRPSSVAATEAPPAPPRMEPERSHQNSKGNCQNHQDSAVLRCNDFPLWPSSWRLKILPFSEAFTMTDMWDQMCSLVLLITSCNWSHLLMSVLSPLEALAPLVCLSSCVQGLSC